MFQKGRQKTGGRQKGGPARKSTRLVDQLKDYGFNYQREMALALKALPEASLDPKQYAAWLIKYNELRALLPYMAPKLREREVELVDPATAAPASSALTDEQLLAAMEKHGTKKEPHPRASHSAPVAKGNPELQVPVAPSPSDDLHDLAAEQEEK